MKYLFKLIHPLYKKYKFLPFHQLDYGRIIDHTYLNDQIGWKIKIPKGFDFELMSNEERQLRYKNLISKRNLDTKQNINNHYLRWTNLIELKKEEKIILRAKYRKIELFENIDLEKMHQDWVQSLKNPSHHINPPIKFEFRNSTIRIDGQQFEKIEFSDIMQADTVFGSANTQLLGIRKKHLIQINFSYDDEDSMEEIWSIINSSKFQNP